MSTSWSITEMVDDAAEFLDGHVDDLVVRPRRRRRSSVRASRADPERRARPAAGRHSRGPPGRPVRRPLVHRSVRTRRRVGLAGRRAVAGLS